MTFYLLKNRTKSENRKLGIWLLLDFSKSDSTALVSMLFNIRKFSGQYDVASSSDWWYTCYTSRDKLGHLWPSIGPPSPSQMDPTPHGSMHCCAPHTRVERCASLGTRLGGCRHHCLCQNTSQYSNTSVSIIRKGWYSSHGKSCPFSSSFSLF